MKRAELLQERRMQKFCDVLGRWEAGGLSLKDAAELLGISERQLRRWRERYEEEGPDGLIDRRLGKPSPKRVPQSPAYTTAPTPLLLVAGDFINNGNTDIAFAAQFKDVNTPGLYDNNFAVFTGDGFGNFYPVTLPQTLLPAQVNATFAGSLSPRMRRALS